MTITSVRLPTRLRDDSGLQRVDYCDGHLITGVGRDRTPEQWVREMLEHAPVPLRQALPPGWFLLGLRHGPSRSAEHVLGWPIAMNTADRIVLQSGSRTGMPAELVFAREGDGWVFGTMVEHDNRAMAVLWRGVAVLHRRIVLLLLRSAAGRVSAGA